jgi:integrase
MFLTISRRNIMAKKKYIKRRVKKNGEVIATKYFPEGTSKAVMRKWREEVLARYLVGISSNRSMKLEDFIPRFFQMKRLHSSNQESTIVKQYADLRHHILPYFKGWPMNEITTRALINWQYDIVFDAENNPDGIKPNTYKNVHSTFKQVLTYAIVDGHIQMNPVTALPRIPVDSTQFNFWTKAQSDLFLGKARQLDWDVFQVVCLALHCGARPGELRGLLRKDLDFNDATVHIRRTWCTKTNSRKDRTKNGLDRRIHLPEPVLRVLEDKASYRPDDQIFGFLCNSWGWRYFKGVQEQINEDLRAHHRDPLPYLRLHDCRHSFASQLAMSRQLSVIEIQSLMGHKKLSSTEIYMHLAEDHLRGATNVLTENVGWAGDMKDSNVVNLRSRRRD